MGSPTYDSPEQLEALEGLKISMGGLMQSLVTCTKSGIPLADAFTCVGMEIPLFLKPMVNQLADKLSAIADDLVTIET